MHMLQADYLLCLDADGQCDAKDFWKFWDARNRCDVVLGWRVNRADTLVRRTFSRLFYLLYRLVLQVPVHDPSCPYVLIPRQVASQLVDRLGACNKGSGGSSLPEHIAAAIESRNCPSTTAGGPPG